MNKLKGRAVLDLSFLVIVFSLLISAGCATDEPSVFPVHDEVITVNLPMDLTFLRTMEAVQTHPEWDLERTVKEEGIIRLRNLRYSSFADADQRRATLVLKRVGARRTSIQFDKKSQSVVGGDEILKLIKEYLS
jgi:hypothetical protein